MAETTYIVSFKKEGEPVQSISVTGFYRTRDKLDELKRNGFEVWHTRVIDNKDAEAGGIISMVRSYDFHGREATKAHCNGDYETEEYHSELRDEYYERIKEQL